MTNNTIANSTFYICQSLGLETLYFPRTIN